MNLKEYKEKLEKEKDRVEDSIFSIQDDIEETMPGSAASELSVIDNHPGDMGTEMYDREKSFALIDNERRILDGINEALDKIDRGTFGYCESCGKKIEGERLEFMPYVKECASCSKQATAIKDYRPSEEDALKYPFGRSFRDIGEDVGYDGEDTWQDVDSFNRREHMERNYDDESPEGYVEEIEKISNEQYKNQLP